MKSKNRKYVFIVSILGCLVLGIYIGNYYLQPKNTYRYIDAPDAILVGRDISLYTNQANAIVIGHVRSVNEPYLTKERGLTLQQDAQVDVKEVLKGDSRMTQVNVGDLGLFLLKVFLRKKELIF